MLIYEAWDVRQGTPGTILGQEAPQWLPHPSYTSQPAIEVTKESSC